MMLPGTLTQAEARRAAERNEWGKQCADGVALMRFGHSLVADEQLCARARLVARLSVGGTGAERDPTLELRLVSEPTEESPADAGAGEGAVEGTSEGAALTASLLATPLRRELQLLSSALERHRMHDAAKLPGSSRRLLVISN